MPSGSIADSIGIDPGARSRNDIASAEALRIQPRRVITRRIRVLTRAACSRLTSFVNAAQSLTSIMGNRDYCYSIDSFLRARAEKLRRGATSARSRHINLEADCFLPLRFFYIRKFAKFYKPRNAARDTRRAEPPAKANSYTRLKNFFSKIHSPRLHLNLISDRKGALEGANYL